MQTPAEGLTQPPTSSSWFVRGDSNGPSPASWQSTHHPPPVAAALVPSSNYLTTVTAPQQHMLPISLPLPPTQLPTRGVTHSGGTAAGVPLSTTSKRPTAMVFGASSRIQSNANRGAGARSRASTLHTQRTTTPPPSLQSSMSAPFTFSSGSSMFEDTAYDDEAPPSDGTTHYATSSAAQTEPPQQVGGSNVVCSSSTPQHSQQQQHRLHHHRPQHQQLHYSSQSHQSQPQQLQQHTIQMPMAPTYYVISQGVVPSSAGPSAAAVGGPLLHNMQQHAVLHTQQMSAAPATFFLPAHAAMSPVTLQQQQQQQTTPVSSQSTTSSQQTSHLVQWTPVSFGFPQPPSLATATGSVVDGVLMAVQEWLQKQLCPALDSYCDELSWLFDSQQPREIAGSEIGIPDIQLTTQPTPVLGVSGGGGGGDPQQQSMMSSKAALTAVRPYYPAKDVIDGSTGSTGGGGFGSLEYSDSSAALLTPSLSIAGVTSLVADSTLSTQFSMDLQLAPSLSWQASLGPGTFQESAGVHERGSGIVISSTTTDVNQNNHPLVTPPLAPQPQPQPSSPSLDADPEAAGGGWMHDVVIAAGVLQELLDGHYQQPLFAGIPFTPNTTTAPYIPVGMVEACIANLQWALEAELSNMTALSARLPQLNAVAKRSNYRETSPSLVGHSAAVGPPAPVLSSAQPTSLWSSPPPASAQPELHSAAPAREAHEWNCFLAGQWSTDAGVVVPETASQHQHQHHRDPTAQNSTPQTTAQQTTPAAASDLDGSSRCSALAISAVPKRVTPVDVAFRHVQRQCSASPSTAALYGIRSPSSSSGSPSPQALGLASSSASCLTSVTMKLRQARSKLDAALAIKSETKKADSGVMGREEASDVGLHDSSVSGSRKLLEVVRKWQSRFLTAASHQTAAAAAASTPQQQQQPAAEGHTNNSPLTAAPAESPNNATLRCTPSDAPYAVLALQPFLGSPSMAIRVVLAAAEVAGVATPNHIVAEMPYVLVWVPCRLSHSWSVGVRLVLSAFASAGAMGGGLPPPVLRLHQQQQQPLGGRAANPLAASRMLQLFAPSVIAAAPTVLMPLTSVLAVASPFAKADQNVSDLVLPGTYEQPQDVDDYWQMHLSSCGGNAPLELVANAIGAMVGVKPSYMEHVGKTKALNVWVPLVGRDGWMRWSSHVASHVDTTGEWIVFESANNSSSSSSSTQPTPPFGHHHQQQLPIPTSTVPFPCGGLVVGSNIPVGPYQQQPPPPPPPPPHFAPSSGGGGGGVWVGGIGGIGGRPVYDQQPASTHMLIASPSSSMAIPQQQHLHLHSPPGLVYNTVTSSATTPSPHSGSGQSRFSLALPHLSPPTPPLPATGPVAAAAQRPGIGGVMVLHFEEITLARKKNRTRCGKKKPAPTPKSEKADRRILPSLVGEVEVEDADPMCDIIPNTPGNHFSTEVDSANVPEEVDEEEESSRPPETLENTASMVDDLLQSSS